MKIQPYVDSWVSETQVDSSYPARVLLWCLSPLPTVCLEDFYRAAKVTIPAVCFACNFLPTSSFPTIPLSCFPYFGNVNVLLVDTVHEC